MKNRKILKKEIPEKLKLPLTLLLGLLLGLVLSLAETLIRTQSLHQMLGALGSHSLSLLATALFLALLALFFAWVTWSLFAGGLIVSLLLLVTAYVNYFKTLLTTVPLQLTDLALATKLGEITKLNQSAISFSRNSILAGAAVLVFLGLLFVLSRPLRTGWKKSLPCAGAAAILFALLFCVRPVANSWLYGKLYIPTNSNYGQSYVTGQVGPVLGIWRSVIAGGGQEELGPAEEEAMLAEAKALVSGVEAGGGDVQPNVIVILSESFFDLTELPGVAYASDPLADFHRAQAEGVSGSFYTRSLGYGTCSIEMELLTGINTRYLPNDQLLSQWTPEDLEILSTVPRLFQQAGYYSAYLHTFDDSIYNRTPTYSHLGFDDLYFSGDFAAFLPEAAAAEDYWSYMQTRLSGGYYSDALLADGLIALYEKEGDRPVFLYGASMENHSPYTADKYGEYTFPFSSELSGEEAALLQTLTQGAANSSAALGRLMDYFRDCEEPTVIVFYGDHRPGLPLETGGSLYARLGLAPEDSADWSVAETAELCRTDYVIWANDERLLPAPAGTKDLDSSCSYLGLDILRAADLELDGYWRMLGSLQEDSLIWTWDYFLDAEGRTARLPEEVLDGAALRKTEIMTWLMRQAFSGEEPLFYALS